MKNLSAISFGLALAAIGLAGCDKNDDAIYDVSFFTTKSSGVHTLFIDGVEKGALTYFATAPECGQQIADGAQLLKFQLPSGSYSVSGQNEHGKATTQATITITESGIAGSGGLGGMSMSKNESCVIVGLSE